MGADKIAWLFATRISDNRNYNSFVGNWTSKGLRANSANKLPRQASGCRHRLYRLSFEVATKLQDHLYVGRTEISLLPTQVSTMAHEAAFENPLLSTKPTDSNITISLHPLVLLTVSDHITRHRVRRQDGPIVGALLGQQKGRETTVEHAFQCKAITNTTGQVILDQSWFEERLQQCEGYRNTALDVAILTIWQTGMFTKYQP